MNTNEVIEYLKNSNEYVNESLVDGFVNDKVVKYLPLDVIEYCVLNKKVQLIIINLEEWQLKLVSQIIKYTRNNNQDWISLCANFIHLFDGHSYDDLLEDIKINGLIDEDVGSFLFLISNSRNFYDIKNVNDLKRIKEIRLLYNERYRDTNDPNVIFILKYGISYDKAYNYYKRYANDVEKMNDSKEKLFLEDIKNIIEGRGCKDRYYEDIDFINNIDSYLRNYFSGIYNKYLFKLSDASLICNYDYENNLVPIYDAGVDFTMCIYSLGVATDLEKPSNYKNDWMRKYISVDYMCNSIVNSLNMKTSIKHCVYGFSNIGINELALLGPNDLGTGGIYGDVNVTNPYYSSKLIADVEFRLPNELINNTRFTNNELYRSRRKLINGHLEKISPDYIVYFKRDVDYKNDSIWNESLKAACDFSIPIVVVDCEKCLVYNISKLENILVNFEKKYDDIESIRVIIEMIYCIKNGYKFAPKLVDKYFYTDKLYSIVIRIVNHLDDMAKLSPNTAIKGIDLFLSVIDEEYSKILKSPFWVEYAKKNGSSIDKPEDIIEFLNKMKQQISLVLEKENDNIPLYGN